MDTSTYTRMNHVGVSRKFARREGVGFQGRCGQSQALLARKKLRKREIEELPLQFNHKLYQKARF